MKPKKLKHAPHVFNNGHFTQGEEWDPGTPSKGWPTEHHYAGIEVVLAGTIYRGILFNWDDWSPEPCIRVEQIDDKNTRTAVHDVVTSTFKEMLPSVTSRKRLKSLARAEEAQGRHLYFLAQS